MFREGVFTMRMRWIKNKKIQIMLGIFVMLVTVATIPTILSYLTSRDSIVNPFKLGTVDVEIKEIFTVPTEINPWEGQTWTKNVSIENKGTQKSLIRVAIVPRWENIDGTPFAGDTSLLILTLQNMNTTPGWVDGKDGYYYYTEKVITGGVTLPVLATVALDSEKIDGNIQKRYANKKLIVDVQAEAVHAYQPAYESVWSTMAKSGSTTDLMLEALIATP